MIENWSRTFLKVDELLASLSADQFFVFIISLSDLSTIPAAHAL